MNKLYTNLHHPASFSGVDNLYREYKKVDPSVTRKDVIHFLRGQSTYTRHKIQSNKFIRRKIRSKGPGNIIAVDTAYLLELQSDNNNVRYLLFVIDLYSRFLTVYPMKTMRASEICTYLSHFLSNNIYTYNKITSDEGSEFTSDCIKLLYKKFNILQYHVSSREIKSSIAERVIRTIKSKIYKYLTESNQSRYIDKLQDIVDTYNITEHKGLCFSPPYNIHLLDDVTDILSFSKKMYKYDNSHLKQVSSQLSLDQHVRLKRLDTTQSIFRKGYKIRNTDEVFKIYKVNKQHVPVTYNIQTLDNDEIIDGIFYKQELILVNKPEVFKINILKSRKKNGIQQYFVNYTNYPGSKPRWIPASDLVV